MKHLVEAWEAQWQHKNKEGNINLMDFLSIDSNKLSINIQDGTINNAGINGMQVTDLLEYLKYLYISLNHAHPCVENINTIRHIEHALKEQHLRTVDREARGVEGENAN